MCYQPLQAPWDLCYAVSQFVAPWDVRMLESCRSEQVNPLKAYRDENGLSQQDIAEKLDISRQMVGFLETGARKCTSDMALLIERRLGIDRALMLPELFARQVAA